MDSQLRSRVSFNSWNSFKLGPAMRHDIPAADGKVDITALPTVSPGPGAKQNDFFQPAALGQGYQLFLPIHTAALTTPG